MWVSSHVTGFFEVVFGVLYKIMVVQYPNTRDIMTPVDSTRNRVWMWYPSYIAIFFQHYEKGKSRFVIFTSLVCFLLSKHSRSFLFGFMQLAFVSSRIFSFTLYIILCLILIFNHVKTTEWKFEKIERKVIR